MHVFSKLVALAAQPLLWIFAILAIAVLAPRIQERSRRRVVVLCMALLLLLGLTALPNFGIRQLENQYPEIALQQDLSRFHGVVILGGALDSGHIARDRVHPVLNGSAERMTSAVALARLHPHLKLVFTGGEGQLFGTGPSEAERAQHFFASMGLSSDRVLLESASRNTYENAVMTARLSGVDARKPWLLVTSAWHMPRSMQTFKKAGWNVTAYPVDFRTGQHTPWTEYDTTWGVQRWSLLLHEWIGLAAYALAGRT